MISGFGKFIMRGNVVDLAVAVVMGAAFGAVVTALVKDLITPVIAALFGKPDFSYLGFTINNSRFPVGDFLNALISFVLISAAVYYFIVLPIDAATSRLKPKTVDEPTVKECPECLSEVPLAARRCKFCTSTLAA